MNLVFPILVSWIIPEAWYTLGAALVVILVDVAVGVLASIVTSTFDVRKLPSFLRQNVLPYLGALTLLALVAAQPEMKVLFFAAAAAVVAKFLADIKDKIGKMIGFDPNAAQTPPSRPVTPAPAWNPIEHGIAPGGQMQTGQAPPQRK